MAGPQPEAVQDQKEAEEDDTEADPELRLRGYKESFVREYDGIKVYHHQGRYQHITEQFLSAAKPNKITRKRRVYKTVLLNDDMLVFSIFSLLACKWR